MPSVTRIWARCVAHSYQRTADLLIVDFTDQTADLLCWCITWKLLKKKKKRVTLEVIITWRRLCGRGQSQMRGNTKQIQNSRYILNDYNKSTSSKCRIAVQMIETEIKAMHVFAQSCLLVGSHIKIMDFITQLCEDCCTCSLISEPLRDQTPWPLLQRSELGQQVISILTRAGSKGVIWCRISVISTHNTPHNRLGCSPDCVFIPLMSRARGNISAVGQMIYMCSVQMTLQRWCLHQPTGRWVNCTWSSSYFVTNAKLKFDFIIVKKKKKKTHLRRPFPPRWLCPMSPLSKLIFWHSAGKQWASPALFWPGGIRAPLFINGGWTCLSRQHLSARLHHGSQDQECNSALIFLAVHNGASFLGHYWQELEWISTHIHAEWETRLFSSLIWHLHAST